ncbi:MAG: low molecular weight protein arginine phosphatase [Pseudomonadota bacterium]|nr:low molecular weight protein arginine phosphatase [Pseudomonadota bacterium]
MTEPHHLLFVCTANIARSPMADALARRYAEERGWRVEVQSAGTHAMTGEPAAPNSVKAVREVGGDLSEHRSQPVTDALVAWADRILVMEMRHAQDVRERFPASDEKVQLLGTFGGLVEISDPYGSWIFTYRRRRDEIRACVEACMDRLPPRPR